MKKEINYKTLIITSTVCLALVAGGAFAGDFLGKRFFAKTVDYSGLDASELEDNNSKAFKEFDSYQEADKSLSEYVSHFTPTQLANIGINQSGKNDHSVIKATGLVDAGVKQSILSYHIRNEEDFFFESISYGLFSVAKRFYQDSSEVNWYKGDYDKSKATWDESSKTTDSITTFETSWGKDLSRQSVYIISSKTVLSTSTAIVDGENIVISLDLDPIYSVVRYVKQMTMMSALESDPVFKKVNYTMTLDSNFQIIKTYSKEDYRVKKFGWNDASGWLQEDITYNTTEVIPDINTEIIY